jgi:hypothetical protein
MAVAPVRYTVNFIEDIKKPSNNNDRSGFNEVFNIYHAYEALFKER